MAGHTVTRLRGGKKAKEMPNTPEGEAEFWGGGSVPIELAPDHMRSIFMMITTDLARLWLKRNTRNRKIRPYTVAFYAGDMGGKNWGISETAICFSVTGVLLNGQHRLEACLMSGIPFPSFVVFGMADENFIYIDTHIKRSRTDRFTIQNEVKPGALAGTVTWLWRYEKNALSTTMNVQPTPAQEQELLDRHPGIRDSVAFVSDKVFAAIGNKTMFAMIHLIIGEKDPKDQVMADVFFDCVASGSMLRQDDPAYQLREKLIADRSSLRSMRRVDKCALAIKAWNLTKAGKTVKHLVWKGKTEPFPEFS